MAKAPDKPARNPRLDQFRDRAAVFTDDEGRRGHFYVEPHQMSIAVGGHLWWKRWSPLQEFVILWLETPDGYNTDTWIYPDDIEDELDDWNRGQFRYLGATYRLSWLDDDATREVRRALDIEEL